MLKTACVKRQAEAKKKAYRYVPFDGAFLNLEMCLNCPQGKDIKRELDMGECKVEGCTRDARCRGFCMQHYDQWRHGTLEGYGEFVRKLPRGPAEDEMAQDFLKHRDPIKEFVKQHCRIVDIVFETAKFPIYSAYRNWTIEEDIRSVGASEFFKQLEEKYPIQQNEKTISGLELCYGADSVITLHFHDHPDLLEKLKKQSKRNFRSAEGEAMSIISSHVTQ